MIKFKSIFLRCLTWIFGVKLQDLDGESMATTIFNPRKCPMAVVLNQGLSLLLKDSDRLGEICTIANNWRSILLLNLSLVAPEFVVRGIAWILAVEKVPTVAVSACGDFYVLGVVNSNKTARIDKDLHTFLRLNFVIADARLKYSSKVIAVCPVQ